jgi:hypothetical protein
MFAYSCEDFGDQHVNKILLYINLHIQRMPIFICTLNATEKIHFKLSCRSNRLGSWPFRYDINGTNDY